MVSLWSSRIPKQIYGIQGCWLGFHVSLIHISRELTRIRTGDYILVVWKLAMTGENLSEMIPLTGKPERKRLLCCCAYHPAWSNKSLCQQHHQQERVLWRTHGSFAWNLNKLAVFVITDEIPQQWQQILYCYFIIIIIIQLSYIYSTFLRKCFNVLNIITSGYWSVPLLLFTRM